MKTCREENKFIVCKRKALSSLVDPTLPKDQRLTPLLQGFADDIPFFESDHPVSKSTFQLIETLK
jgi:hypothetical protein